MKILVIHDRYQQAGGENAVVDAQVDLFKQMGNEVILYQRDNHEIENYTFLQKIHFFLSSIYSFRTTREIRMAVQDEHPDITYVHNVFPLISPSIYRVLAKERLPFVQIVHNFRFLCPNGLFYRQGQICELCKMGHYGNAIRWKCYRNSLPLSLLYATTIWLHRKIGSFDNQAYQLVQRNALILSRYAKRRMFFAQNGDCLAGVCDVRCAHILQPGG